MLLNRKKKRLQKQYYCIPLNHSQLEVFIYVMLFDSMSDLKSFLQDRNVPMLRLIASPPLDYLGVKPAHLLRQMLTIQTPKKF